MSDELKELLVKMDERLERQEKMMQQLINIVADNKENITGLNGRFDNVDKRLEEVEDRLDIMDQRSERIESVVNRIEKNEPENIMSLLKNISTKLDDRDNDIQALNKRVFKTESEIERLTRQ